MAVKIKLHRRAWWLFIDHQGQRKAKRVGVGKPGKKAAELAAAKIAARLADGGPIEVDEPAPTQEVPTFAAVAQEWLQKYPALHAIRPATLDNYRSFTERHLIPAFGRRPITEITPTAIEDFIESKRLPGGSIRRKGKALADSSLRTGLLALRLILQRAVRTKRLPANPMHEVEWRGLPRMENVDPFTTAEVRAILETAGNLDPDFATLLRLWAQSGMRAGEVVGFQWHDVDLTAGTVLVRRTWSRQRLGPTKTGVHRSVSFLHPVAGDSSEWRPGGTEDTWLAVEGLRGLTVRSLVPEAFVFGRGGSPLSSMDVHRRWRRVLSAARVRYRQPEQLRHTFASTLLSRNAPLLYVQGQGGWRSASVLLRVYARWMPQAVAASTQAQPAATPAQPGSAAAASFGGGNAG